MPSVMKESVVLVSVLMMSLLTVSIKALSTGAPISCCEAMDPQHPASSGQTSRAPFETRPDTTQISSGSTLQLTLSSTDGVTAFRGYLIEAFDSAQPEGPIIGTFSAPSDGQIIDCPNGPSLQNAATHQINNDKTSVTVNWTAPAGFVGSVFFKTTFVQETTIYWVKVISPTVNVVAAV